MMKEVFMSQTQHQQHQTRWLLNILMIVLETVYSFVLKHDRMVKLQARKLVAQETCIKINSYLPYFDFYVQFSQKGLLFDLRKPEQEINVTINTTFYDLIKIFIFGNSRAVRKLRFEGDLELRDPLCDLFINMSAPKLLSDWKYWITHPTLENLGGVSKKRIRPLLEKIDAQRSTISNLQLELKQIKNQKRKLESKQKMLARFFYFVVLLLIISVVYNVRHIMQ